MKPLKTSCIAAIIALLTPALVAEVLVSSGSFTVDRTEPTVPALVSPANGDSLSGAFLQLAVSATDATSGIDGYEFEVNTASAGWQRASTHSIWDAESDTYLWRCRARDRAGNQSDWSASFTVGFTADANADADGDGLADSWEGRYFGRLDHSDGSLDSDGDGLTDAEEFSAESHPFEFLMNVNAGWNLLSLPFDGTDTGLLSLRAHAVGDRFLEWDGRRYVDLGIPRAYQGFWIFATSEQHDVPVSGTPVDGANVAVLKGWNVVGPRDEVTGSANDAVRSVLRWDGRRLRTMSNDAPMSPFTGYFLLSREDTVIQLGSDGK